MVDRESLKVNISLLFTRFKKNNGLIPSPCSEGANRDAILILLVYFIVVNGPTTTTMYARRLFVA